MSNESDLGAPDEGSRDIPTDASSLRERLLSLGVANLGSGTIYAALEVLANEYHLTDAVVVLSNDWLGTQFFRLGSLPTTSFPAGTPPGVYCRPDVVPRYARETVFEVCQSAFAHIVSPLSESSEMSPRDAVATSPAEESPEASRNALERAIPTNRRRERLGAPRTSRRHSWSVLNARELVAICLIAVDVLALAASFANLHDVVRYLLGLTLGLVVPGWSVVGLMRLSNPALEWSLTMATSLSLIMLAAQLMMTMNLWHPVALEELTCLVCLPLLTFQVARGRRSAESSA